MCLTLLNQVTSLKLLLKCLLYLSNLLKFPQGDKKLSMLVFHAYVIQKCPHSFKVGIFLQLFQNFFHIFDSSPCWFSDSTSACQIVNLLIICLLTRYIFCYLKIEDSSFMLIKLFIYPISAPKIPRLMCFVGINVLNKCLWMIILAIIISI